MGLILPADNVVMEPELYAVGLPGVSFHSIRLTTTEHTAMRRQGVSFLDVLAELGVDIVVYGCAETSFDGGGGHEGFSAMISSASPVPVVTATEAMIQAITYLGLCRIGLVTPYRYESGVLLEKTLAGSGFVVSSATHHCLSSSLSEPREWYATNRSPATDTYQWVRAADGSDIDGIVVSATNLQSLAVLAQAEADLGKPVVSSNQAILWWCLRRLGLKAPIHGWGSLLADSK